MILCLWLLCIWFIFSARAGSEKSKIAWEFRGMSRGISFGSQWVNNFQHTKVMYFLHKKLYHLWSKFASLSPEFPMCQGLRGRGSGAETELHGVLKFNCSKIHILLNFNHLLLLLHVSLGRDTSESTGRYCCPVTSRVKCHSGNL